ncbi:hypothetical protein sos41_10810 [Alphaproteobacteria bacterium SO-S41]|nr:hypothetical protein sos41_10810 [Alphaproteobacteria bacterium SO-S41]
MSRTLLAASIALLFSVVPAWAQDADEGGTYGQVIANTEAAWVEPEGSTATPEQIQEKATFFVGNIAWLTMHEFGHMAVSEFNLPVLGREEDGADSFATINMIAEDSDPGLEEMITDVIDAWFTAGLYANNPWGEHSVDEQRAYAVVCLLVGEDPEGWKEVADDSEMPEKRQQGCAWEYKQHKESWDNLLAEHELDEGEAPTGEISVVYEDAGEFGTAGALLQATGVLEQIGYDMEHRFKLTGPITISVEQCGQANAFYVPNERKVKICYELANFFLLKGQQLHDADKTGTAEPQ